ncbi:heavy metal translocating P-type ATPase [Devosia sp.]|uniref:heavy metal translocating P-type ATPase n=1 Tax=Devosia sp. TaxID=1871048 RepID=UPI002EFDA0F9
MTCCAPGAESFAVQDLSGIETDEEALLALSRKLGDGTRQLEFAVPDAHCASCIRSIETALDAMPQVQSARVNLSRRRVRVVFDPARGSVAEIAPAIVASGYHTHVVDPEAESDGDPVLRELVKALAVAGFAAGNIMLFSVSVWSGAEGATRDLFHWISALIAVPAIAYAGRPFFRSAWRALRVGRTNMDVPISIGVVLAALLSLFETLRSGEHAYFDASTTLLFFLLIGRTLDHLMRERARSAVTNLARLAPRGAVQVLADGRREYVALNDIAPGMELELKAGERVPVDATVLSGASELDYAIVTGETRPLQVGPGSTLMAGANNLSGTLTIRCDKPSEESFLARMAAMMEAAEGAKSSYRRIADRAAAIYAPAVHTLAILTFLGWGVLSGDWHAAILNAVAVLIITCPCALALAVPIVHVVAAGRLFEGGVLMKDGVALERAAQVDGVAFDKTGTLTYGTPRLVRSRTDSDEAMRVAAALAARSTHPLSRALAATLPATPPFAGETTEVAGFGIEGRIGTTVWRLGNARWDGIAGGPEGEGSQVWISRDGQPMGYFEFADEPRADAAAAIAALETAGLPVSILSGDRRETVAALAARLGVADFEAGLLPEDKVAAIHRRGRVMMVGDGINDAPALRAAHVSMAPSTAADIGRSAADFVFTGEKLAAVPFVLGTARRAAAIVRQNIAIAIGYNFIAVPLAVTGHVTPLIAAIAMSGSSIVVVVNALRLRLRGARATAAIEPVGLQPSGVSP